MYSTKLEEKIDAAVKRWQNVEKRKMFGGVGYLLKGNMCFGIFKDSLIVRIDKEQGEQRLKDRDVQPLNINGKTMAGWVMVKETEWDRPDSLTKWIDTGKRFALSLPEKKGKRKKTKTLREYKV
ncbi:MAG TPA: TfoX/Sxy family protein [Nitrospirota bacterium]|nr:TfoX/Sxy family protein [Nitrospirota bacterium]